MPYFWDSILESQGSRCWWDKFEVSRDLAVLNLISSSQFNVLLIREMPGLGLAHYFILKTLVNAECGVQTYRIPHVSHRAPPTIPTPLLYHQFCCGQVPVRPLPLRYGPRVVGSEIAQSVQQSKS